MLLSSVVTPPAPPSGDAEQLSTPGFTTVGLGAGDFGYVSGANIITKTDASGLVTAQVIGANEGTFGSMTTEGIIEAAKFTTDGGSPVNGAPVYLALGTADGGTGAGKLSATPPLGNGQVIKEVGLCTDNTNYASMKTCKIYFAPKLSIVL